MSQRRLIRSPDKRKQRIARRGSRSDSARSFHRDLHSPIRQLQQMFGNQRVAQLIQAKRLTPDGKIVGLQRKLTVGAADDRYEQEADRVVSRVLSMPDAAVANSMQRASEAEEDKDKTLQTKPLADFIKPVVQSPIGEDYEQVRSIQARSARSLADSFEAGADIESQVSLSKGHGSVLPEPVRGSMEPRFGMDFSHVRVHTGNDAIQINRNVGAQAFTHGSDIYFGGGHSPTNLELTAHELTHVIQQSGAWQFGAAQSTNERRLAPSLPSITGVIARQPDPSPPPDPGWSDAPEKGLNKWVTTVDEKGNIVPGKAASKGVWRVPVQSLSHGLQKGDKGPAFESSEGRAVALIPNTVNPTAADKKDNVPVDVLLHLHGFGVGYRELKPGKHDYAGVLEAGQARDVELYQMEQQLLSHVKASKRLIIAVLPQGSEWSDFGDLSSNSDAYLKEVFAKLIPKYLPNGAIPGRVIVSGHSGGGPTAMAIAAKAKTRTDVFLFDAINYGCTEKEEVKDKEGNTVKDKKGNPKMQCKKGSPCASNEYFTASKWVTDRIKADIKSLDGKPEDRQPAELQTNGTRFRGYTSASLTTKNTCSYGYWYNKLKTDIETTITKLKVSEAVANQLRQNYQVQEAKGLTGFKKSDEPHERVMGQGNLEAALKD